MNYVIISKNKCEKDFYNAIQPKDSNLTYTCSHHLTMKLTRCISIFNCAHFRFLTVFESLKSGDNTLVTMVPYGDEMYTATETIYWNKIDPETLDRSEKVTMSKSTTNK